MTLSHPDTYRLCRIMKFLMPRPHWSYAYALTTTVAAVAVMVWTAVEKPFGFLISAAFFAALVAIASFIRVDSDEGTFGFEAAVVFAAILLTHDSAIALVSVFFGVAIYNLYADIAARQFRIRSLVSAAELALSYYVVALLYTLAVMREAPLLAKSAGYVLLMIGYLLLHIAFPAVRFYVDGRDDPFDVRRILIAQARILLVVTPVVAIECLGYRVYGLGGFALGFVPVLLIAYAMRNETDAHRRNAELVRRNRELSILTESATQILSAEGDQETLRRMVTLLTQLAKLKACAIVTWETNPDVPGTVYRDRKSVV